MVYPEGNVMCVHQLDDVYESRRSAGDEIMSSFSDHANRRKVVDSFSNQMNVMSSTFSFFFSLSLSLSVYLFTLCHLVLQQYFYCPVVWPHLHIDTYTDFSVPVDHRQLHRLPGSASTSLLCNLERHCFHHHRHRHLGYDTLLTAISCYCQSDRETDNQPQGRLVSFFHIFFLMSCVDKHTHTHVHTFGQSTSTE